MRWSCICRKCGRQFYGMNDHGRSMCYDCHPLPYQHLIPQILARHHEGVSGHELAVEFSLSRNAIMAIVNTYDHAHPVGSGFIQFPDVHLDQSFLDGWLASDGHLARPSFSSNAYAQFKSARRSYTEYVKSRFESMGFTASAVSSGVVPSARGYVREGGYPWFQVGIHSHPILTAQYIRWYPGGHRHLPADFNLTAESLLQWYLGDGTLDKKAPILVNCLYPSDVLQHIADQANALLGGGVTVNYRKSRPSHGNIYFGLPASRSFFGFIGSCPVAEYAYKWVSQGVV